MAQAHRDHFRGQTIFGPFLGSGTIFGGRDHLGVTGTIWGSHLHLAVDHFRCGPFWGHISTCLQRTIFGVTPPLGCAENHFRGHTSTWLDFGVYISSWLVARPSGDVNPVRRRS